MQRTKYNTQTVCIFLIKKSARTNKIAVGILITNPNCFMVCKMAAKVILSARAPKLYIKYSVTIAVANKRTIKN